MLDDSAFAAFVVLFGIRKTSWVALLLLAVIMKREMLWFGFLVFASINQLFKFLIGPDQPPINCSSPNVLFERLMGCLWPLCFPVVPLMTARNGLRLLHSCGWLQNTLSKTWNWWLQNMFLDQARIHTFVWNTKKNLFHPHANHIFQIFLSAEQLHNTDNQTIWLGMRLFFQTLDFEHYPHMRDRRRISRMSTKKMKLTPQKLIINIKLEAACLPKTDL